MRVRKELRRIADRQGGYFNAQQALQAGYSHDLQSYHCKSGNWLRVDRALYRLPGFLDSEENEFIRWTLWAAAKSPGRTCAISHESALHFYGLRTQRPKSVHLTLPHSRASLDSEGCTVHLAPLPESDCAEYPGYAVTTVARTLEDLRPDLCYTGLWPDLLRQAQERGLLTGQAALQLSEGAGVSLAASMHVPSGGLRGEAPWTETSACLAGQRGGIVSSRRWERGVSNRSFTLVEMLVVIAIIGILAALLMPALTSALTSARSASCLNNQKQIYMAITAYADQWNSSLPPILGGASTAFRPLWNEALNNQKLVEKSLFVCPQMPSSSIIWPYTAHYGLNQGLYTNVTPGESKRISQIATPSKKILMLDSYRSLSNGGSNFNEGFCYVWFWDFTNVNSGRPAGRHSQNCNSLWLDGHTSGIPVYDPDNPCLQAPFIWGSNLQTLHWMNY